MSAKKELTRIAAALKKDADVFREQADRLDRYCCGLRFYGENLEENEAVKVVDHLKKLLPEHFSN